MNDDRTPMEKNRKAFELAYAAIPAITPTKETAWLIWKAALSAAPAQEPAEDNWVAKVVSSGPHDFPLLQWRSADVSLDTPIGTLLYASPLTQEVKALTPERIAEIAESYPGEWAATPGFVSWFAHAVERELRGAQEVKAGEDARTRGMAIYRRAKETAMERAALVAFNTYFFKCTPSCDVATWTAAWKKAIAWWTSPVATQQQDFGVGDDRG